MRITYSQNWTKAILDKKIRRLLNFIPLTTPGVLLKVFCYKPKNSYWVDVGAIRFRGNYRFTSIHGFYRGEIKNNRIPKHIVTIKVYPDIPEEKLLYLLAHELGHYKDWRRYKGSKHKCAQKRCDKFAYKCIEKWKVGVK